MNDNVATAPEGNAASAIKRATISEQNLGVFGLEYDNTLGKKHTMRLDATTYEKALREARSYLGISEDDHDEAGDQWAVE
jgi:hypothetical protein